MSMPSSAAHNDVAASPSTGRFVWSVADILVCAVLAVASGFVFSLYNGPGYGLYKAIDAVTPGLGGLATGPWLFAGVLGGLVIRKPGAAIACEVVAACVSAAIGNQWGIETVYSGLAQGLGAEVVLAFFVYRRFNLLVAAIAGVGTGVGAWILEFFLGNAAKGFEFNIIYLISLSISGAVIAGVAVYFLVRALAATGALNSVAAGRENQKLV